MVQTVRAQNFAPKRLSIGDFLYAIELKIFLRLSLPLSFQKSMLH